MKKIFIIMSCAAIFAACGQSGEKEERTQSQIDSLQAVINQKDGELNKLMDTFNEIQTGFDQINAAEDRVNLNSGNAEQNRQSLQEDMQFIQQKLEENRLKIEELQNKLKQSGIKSASLQKTIDNLKQQLAAQDKIVKELRAQLAQKDIRIAQLGESISRLASENSQIQQAKAETEEIANKQDEQLNTAWYVYGTKSELKEHKILVSGDVLKEADFDADYFTKIDIREKTSFPVNSKSAEVLTSHPTDSYELVKDAQGLYTLRVIDAAKFWSVSKYLVIRVK